MTTSSEDQFYTDKHLKLTRIAYFANIIAWVVLGVQIICTWGKYVEFQSLFNPSITIFHGTNGFLQLLTSDPINWTRMTAEMFSIFLRGVVYWLVLKGTSSGLYMIVETDLNYKEKFQRESHE